MSIQEHNTSPRLDAVTVLRHKLVQLNSTALVDVAELHQPLKDAEHHTAHGLHMGMPVNGVLLTQ